VIRSIQDAMRAANLVSSLVSHDETVQSRISLAEKHRYALQCDLGEITREGTRKSGMYKTKLTFTFVETGTGRVLLTKSMEGICTDVSAGPSTAFYKCVTHATGLLLTSQEAKLIRDTQAK